MITSTKRILSEVSEIKEIIIGLPFHAQEYGNNVFQTLIDIEQSISDKGFASVGEERAISNIRKGLERFL
jgi:hypothetical protein